MHTATRDISLCFLLGVLLLLATGCTTPHTRAGETSASFRQLSPSDKELALSGRIREGFDKDAVYVAWGAPSHTYAMIVGQENFDLWIYSHVEYGVAGGFFGVSRGFVYHGRYFDPVPRAGGSNDFYSPPPYIRGLPPPETEVPYKKVVFDHGHVINYESLRQSSSPVNANTQYKSRPQ